MKQMAFELPRQQIQNFCRRHHIRKLALFGSILRPDFRADSDIDVLVEFDSAHIPGLAFFGMQEELSALFGRKVDLNTSADLSRYYRDKVLPEAETRFMAQHDDAASLRQMLDHAWEAHDRSVHSDSIRQ